MTMQPDDMNPEKCPWHKHHGHHAIRTLTAVIVLIFVFWCGFEFGEIRASVGSFHQGFGSEMMRGSWGAPSERAANLPMMGASAAGQTVPAGTPQTAPTGNAK